MVDVNILGIRDALADEEATMALADWHATGGGTLRVSGCGKGRLGRISGPAGLSLDGPKTCFRPLPSSE